MKATFENSVSVLVRAYMNDTLIHGNCFACAVGNLIVDANKYTYVPCVDRPAAKFVAQFDGSTPEERVLLPEFSFEIDVPSEVIEKIGIGEVYRVLSESKTLELVMEPLTNGN